MIVVSLAQRTGSSFVIMGLEAKLTLYMHKWSESHVRQQESEADAVRHLHAVLLGHAK